MDEQNPHYFYVFGTSEDAPTAGLHAVKRQTPESNRPSTDSDVFTEFEELTGTSIDHELTQDLEVPTLPTHKPIRSNVRSQSVSDSHGYTTARGRDDSSGDTASYPRMPKIHLQSFAYAHIVDDACVSSLFAPDSSSFACEFSDGKASIYSYKSVDKESPLDEGVPAVVFTSPIGNPILFGINDGLTCSSSSLGFGKRAQPDIGKISQLYASIDERLIASLGDDGALRLWEIGADAEVTKLCGIGHSYTRIDPATIEGFLSSYGFSKDEACKKTHALFGCIDSLRENRAFSNGELKTSLNANSLIMPVLEQVGREKILGGIWNFAESSLWEVSHHQINPDTSYISNNGTRLAYVTNDTLYLYEIGGQGATTLDRAARLHSFLSKDGRFLAYRTKRDAFVIADTSARRILTRHSVRKLLNPALCTGGISRVKSAARARVGESVHVDWSFHSNDEYVMIIVNHRKAILYDVMNNESVILEQDVLDFESREGRESWTEVSLGGYRLDVDDSDDDQIRVFDSSTNKRVDTIRVLRGVDLTGLDLSMATLADDDRKVLRQNGAEVG